MQIEELALLLLPALIAVFWWHDRGIKQKALRLVRQRCEKLEVQLLDDNVSLSGIRLRRYAMGSMCFQRHFVFEFTSTGERRHQGNLWMLGNRLERIDVGVFLV